jgi:imidazolonepropionase-like amidohydrolase
VAPGYFADLVMLGGNPLADVRRLRDVKRVMKDGVLYTEEGLIRGARR